MEIIDTMLDHDLDKIRFRKAESFLNHLSMPKDIINIYSTEHIEKIMNDYPEKMILCDCWASWCSPCIAFSPIFEKLFSEYSQDFIFTKINVDANKDLAAHFRITGIPTILLIKERALVNKIVGATNYETLKSFLEKLKRDN